MSVRISFGARAPRPHRSVSGTILLSAFVMMVLGACAGPRAISDDDARSGGRVPASSAPSTAERQSKGSTDDSAGAGSRPPGLADTKRERSIGHDTAEDARPREEEVDRGALESGGAEGAPTPDEGQEGAGLPLPRFERFELVTAEASVADRTGDRPGNSWGGHQTRVLRMQNGDVYTAYLTTGAAYYSSQWQLVRRDAAGWHRVASGIAGREPVNILRTPSDGIAVVAWPMRAPLLTTFDFSDGSTTRRETPIPGQWETSDWPYNAAGIGLDGTLCVLQSNLNLSPGAFSWACRSPPNGNWEFRKTSLQYRHCYSYVLPEGKRLTLLATRDVTWPTLGYAKPAGAFDYAFNQIHAYGTEDRGTTALAPTLVREEAPTALYPEPLANGQVDAYLDTEGRLHVIYMLAGQSTGGVRQTRHALLVNGQVIADVQLPKQGWWRITQDSTGRFWALYGTGTRFVVHPALSSDGLTLGQPTELDLVGEQVQYSGMAIAVPRAGVPLDDIVDGVFPSGRFGERWVYFRLRLR